MFEREIKFIYDFNLNKLNKFGSFFSFEQLSSTDIHPAILHYISAELDYLIFEDRQKLVKDSIFDYSGEKVTNYFSLINEELKKSKRLSSDYVAKIILHSISFNVNFLVRPKWALAKFIYEDESHRTAAEIKQILNYLYFYKYLRKILISYLNSKKIISLNSAEFIELLNKIDDVTIQTDYKGVISASLKSMAEFFNIGGVQRTKIPFNAVQIFLEDKGLDAQLAKLREEFANETSGRLELNDVQKLLSSVLMDTMEQSADKEFEEKVMETEITPINHIYEEETEPAKEEKKSHSLMDEESPEHKENNREIFDKEDIPEISPVPDKESGIKELFKVNIPEFEDLLIEEEDAVETALHEEKTHHNIDMDEMEGLIEEGNQDRKEDEDLIVENEKRDYDDWVFVEEEEHNEIIKEIVEPIEEDAKKKKPVRKKQYEEKEEEPLLFEDGNEKSFEEILKEEEKTYKVDSGISGNYDEAHKDFSKLIEHRNMSKLIDILFDCDIEEVELMLNSISFFSTYTEAENFIDTYFVKMGIKANSNEAVAFKEIIKENFDKRM